MCHSSLSYPPTISLTVVAFVFSYELSAWLIEIILQTKTISPHRVLSRIVSFWTGWLITCGEKFESAEPALGDDVEQTIKRVVVHPMDWTAFDSLPEGERSLSIVLCR